MTQDRFQFLLDRAAADQLSEAEERELAAFVEQPEYRARLERELAGDRRRLAELLAYRETLGADAPAIPAATLRKLEAGLARPTKDRRPFAKIIPLWRWQVPAALTALAACVALVLWLQVPKPTTAPRLFEYGFVSADGPVRGASGKTAGDLGPTWRLAPQRSLRSLADWSSADLPANVAARIWIDEEAGRLRAVYRRADGTVARMECPLDPARPVPDQLKRLADQLPRP